MIIKVDTPPEWISIITKCRACCYYNGEYSIVSCSDHDCHGNRNKSRIDIYYVDESEEHHADTGF